MKNLEQAKQILGMKISRDRKSGKLWLSQEVYVEKVLERFNIGKIKFICAPLAGDFKFSSVHCPTSEKKKQEIKRALYALVVGSLIYVMVCIKPDIAHVVGVVSRFLSNLGKEIWTTIKGLSDISEVLPKHGYVLVVTNLCYKCTYMQIWQGTLILKNSYKDICLPLQGEQSYGSPDFSSVLPYYH